MLNHILIRLLILIELLFAIPLAAQTTHYPHLTHADLPLYPPLTRTLGISGKVEIEVTVEKGSVVDAQVKSTEIRVSDPQKDALYDSEAKKRMASQFLSNPSLANIKTWRFRPEDKATFVVTYIYKIEGEQTELPENPNVELHLPLLVKITTRPFKPTCNDCTPEANTGASTKRQDTTTKH